MKKWDFYGRHDTLSTLDSLIHKQRWFFCRIQGRRRIGKTTLLKELMKSDPSLAGRMIYMQVPNYSTLLKFVYPKYIAAD